mgnify:CR=1 FL=1|jgi:hypothetical protein
MPGARRRFLFALLLGALQTRGARAQAEVDDAWFGAWRLDLERSTYEPGPRPYRRASRTIEPWRGGVKVVDEMVGERGGVLHTEWTGRFDGEDYPTKGVDDPLTCAYRRVDARAYDVVTKVDGRRRALSHTVLSPDGRTITTLTIGRNTFGGEFKAITVYRKAD